MRGNISEGEEEDEFSESEVENEEEKQAPLNDQKYLLVEISDTGAGMDEEIKKKCFTLFGACKIQQGINQRGIGLGLASAQLICKALKGQLILVRSEKGKGTTFRFIIEVAIGDEVSVDNNSDCRSNIT